MCNREGRETREVAIDERVATAIEARLRHTRFESVDEYATVALELVLRELAGGNEEADAGHDDREVDDERLAAVEEQLESLGYL